MNLAGKKHDKINFQDKLVLVTHFFHMNGSRAFKKQDKN